jgi:beta-glucosidase-like glycosyl hydrolase
VQDIPNSREDIALDSSIRPANDNSARLPPGLKVASPAISHTSATSLDNTSQQQPASVLAMVAHLQAENGQLLNALLSVQQELNNMNIRYNEVVKLAREREAIKANEMEEARRYILKLEAKLHLLEQDDTSTYDPHEHGAGQRRQERKRQPLSKPNRPLSTGSGDNQDRRRTNNMWRDTRTVKCGNCGEPGHKSADCQVSRI